MSYPPEADMWPDWAPDIPAEEQAFDGWLETNNHKEDTWNTSPQK